MFWLPAGEIWSHVVVPLTPVALAVNAILAEALTERACVGGAEPPAVVWNVNEGGLTVSVEVGGGGGGADAVMTSDTGIVVVPTVRADEDRAAVSAPA